MSTIHVKRSPQTTTHLPEERPSSVKSLWHRSESSVTLILIEHIGGSHDLIDDDVILYFTGSTVIHTGGTDHLSTHKSMRWTGRLGIT